MFDPPCRHIQHNDGTGWLNKHYSTNWASSHIQFWFELRMNSIFLKKQSTLLIQFRKHLKLKLFRESLWYQSILFELVVFVNEERLLFVFIHALVQVFIGSSPVTAVRYKKLERYLFHSVPLCIPWYMRTRNCSSGNVQHTFHYSDKAS